MTLNILIKKIQYLTPKDTYIYQKRQKVDTHMIVVSGRLTELFDGVGHFAVVGICKPDWRRAGIRLL